MMFSKSFGYALRGILYIAVTGNGTKKVRVEDISKETGIPKHFLGKIMNKMVKASIVLSIKGPSGGFYISNKTLSIPLIQLYHLFDGTELFDGCVLRSKKCSEENTCPMHYKVENTKRNLELLLSKTTIGDLLEEEKYNFIQSIA
jgi:Rrf2 family transcriptional regulator, iron-sulfur cluster assembly transcription factor